MGLDKEKKVGYSRKTLEKNMDKIGIFAGTFDCLTLGHCHIIDKAAKIFDKVVVMVAENPSKKPMFNVGERLAMITDFLMKFPKGTTEVVVLPAHAYTAKFSYEKYGQCSLVRSMRDNIDFVYEYNILRTNRQIEKRVETVYLMPDDAYSIVSSSWVKSHVGINGWRDVIKYSVTPYVLECLKKNYLRSEYDKAIDTMMRGMGANHFSFDRDYLWRKIVNSYTKDTRVYHNLDHIISGIEAFNEFFPDGHKLKNGEMLLAWILHDVDLNEDEAKWIARSLYQNYELTPSSHAFFMEIMIEASKHHTCHYESPDEGIFASIDLICLGRSPAEYREYWKKVFVEYLLKSGMAVEDFLGVWKKGRTEFLTKMLAREMIYPCLEIREKYEKQAIENMRLELEILQKIFSSPAMDASFKDIVRNYHQNS